MGTYDVNDVSCRLKYLKMNSTIHLESSVKNERVICADMCGKRLDKTVQMVNMIISPPHYMLDLPSGSSSVDRLTYHNIDIPAVDPIEPQQVLSLIPQLFNKDKIDFEHRKVFQDINHLNLIQSATFNVSYTTDENMLVCAPTASGKTLVAVLCILHELRYFKSVKEFKKTPYKIVYIAPMKALAGEIVQNLRGRLQVLGITVREFTGDMHLRAHEIYDTDVLVTTPEKWDTVTRRNTGSESLFQLVQLMIIDEIHLLNCDRGPVLEAIVARTFGLRDKNSRLRLIGLSATLPNYKEIAQFLHVNPEKGLFYFNWGFRPIPLKLNFIGTKNYRWEKHWDIEDKVCYNKLIEFVRSGQKVIIFAFSRAKVINTALYIEKRADEESDLMHLMPDRQSRSYAEGLQILEKSNMKLLKRLYDVGLSCHHAGMLREDRIRVEALFRDGYIKVLVSTTTLAWGVNLPAHAVIIKGTRYYNPVKSCQTEIDLLDAQQMFGRAGRPQYDTMGEAVLITNQINLPYYLSILNWQIPIQSHLIGSLTDHLNAEIVLKNVSSIGDAIEWLKRTFLYVRMTNQPNHYHVQGNDVLGKCRQLIEEAAKQLVAAGMIEFDQLKATFQSTNIGEVASHTYIMRATIQIINQCLHDAMDVDMLICLLCKSKEFEQIKMRPVESRELTTLQSDISSSIMLKYTTAETRKMAVLIYTYLNRTEITNVQLYLDQDAKRILRACFDIAVIKRFASTVHQITALQKCLEHRCCKEHPLLQYKKLNLPINSDHYKILAKIPLTVLKTLNLTQLMSLIPTSKLASRLFLWIKSLPFVKLSVICYRMTPALVRIQAKVTPDFQWNDAYNYIDVEPWVMWTVNPLTKEMSSLLRFNILRRHVERQETITMDMNVMLNENDPTPEELILHLESEIWLGVEIDYKLSKDYYLPTGALSNFS